MKKVHRVIRFNQKDCSKPYIDMDTKLRLKAKNNFERDFFKLMNTAVFGRTMEIEGHSSDINFQNFMNLYKKCTTKPYYFLVIDNLLH